MSRYWWLMPLAFCVGCGAAEIVSPEIAERASELSSLTSAARDVEAKQDQTIASIEATRSEIVSQNKQIIDTLNKLEASLAKSEQQTGKDGDPASAQEPPAKANTAATPIKVATPGASSETLTELATRLYSQGVSVHMKTEQELRAIDAQLNGGQPVTGSIFQNNRASAVTSQRSAVRLIPRGRSVVQWQNYSTQQSCPSGRCPQRR